MRLPISSIYVKTKRESINKKPEKKVPGKKFSIDIFRDLDGTPHQNKPDKCQAKGK